MADSTKNAALILAAGKGTRMKSQKPKVLHTLLGAPMLGYVLAAAEEIFAGNVIVLAGHKAELLEAAFPKMRFVRQLEQLGTGHALLTALPALEKMGAQYITVINGDAPLLTTETIRDFENKAQTADIAFATIMLPDPGPYGRVVRENGQVAGIVEAKDYDIGKLGPASGEVNGGMYRIGIAAAQELLPQITNKNRSGEYYLTDIIGLGLKAGLKVEAIPAQDGESLLGVNSPLELAQAEELLRQRVAQNLLEKGVIIHGPQFLRACPFASIEPGVEITAPCEIYGNSKIAAGARIDSNCVIIAAIIQTDAVIRSFSHLENAIVGKKAIIGPYARLRPGADIGEGSHVGNFVELKNAVLGKGAKANHLTYLGDAEIGAATNIGAGTISCNYDGKNKHKTSIGENAFIGSNTALVAPVRIGNQALIGAGSVITKDVPDGELAVARGTQKNLPRRKR